ncbi:MAG: peptidoglycan editing factor PgeF [Pseudomonadota bacterium]|nr:peptidoglycan editing factor PgeF [Pseudomonadota bacterium]
MSCDWIVPDWPAPVNVKALITTRQGGVSLAPYAGLNLGDHVGDLPAHVAANRRLLRSHAPVTPRWLKQVHGIQVVNADKVADGIEADAAYTRATDIACTVLTADCLPLLICDRAGTQVAAAHAGWRGLHQGVIERTIAVMGGAPSALLVYLGPAIGPKHYEVGDDVRDAFVALDGEAQAAFKAKENGKWLANLYELARLRLLKLGIRDVFGGDYCTAEDPARFYSYRRDGQTGRMASLIWLGVARQR